MDVKYVSHLNTKMDNSGFVVYVTGHIVEIRIKITTKIGYHPIINETVLLLLKTLYGPILAVGNTDSNGFIFYC